MTYSATILADSPIHYYRLGESTGPTATDEIAANDGTYQGSPTLGESGAVAGDTSVALAYTTTEYVSTTDSVIPSALSIEAWVKWDGSTYAIDGSIGGWMDSPGTRAAQLWVTGDGDAYFTIRMGTDTGSAVSADLVSRFSGGGWHHVVGTIDSSANARIYIDNALETGPSATSFTGTGSSGNPLCIGRTNTTQDAGAKSWPGWVDEFAVYDFDLSLAQVQAHYAAATSTAPVWTTPPDTVGMTTTPELKFTIPAETTPQHFWLELDTANTFDTGDLRTYRSDVSQTNWDYWDGEDSWDPCPAGGVDAAYVGEEMRYTVTDTLATDTWYRRVRAAI